MVWDSTVWKSLLKDQMKQILFFHFHGKYFFFLFLITRSSVGIKLLLYAVVLKNLYYTLMYLKLLLYTDILKIIIIIHWCT